MFLHLFKQKNEKRKCLGSVKNTSFLIRRIFCVGATVAIEEAVNIDEYFIALSLQLH